MSNKIFNNFCISLRNASRARKPIVIVKSNKLVLNTLICLYKDGFVNGYSIFNKNQIKIYLSYYKDKGLLDSLNVFQCKNFSYKALKYLYNGTNLNNYYMLFTCIKGLYKINQLLEFGVGGQLILCIDLP